VVALAKTEAGHFSRTTLSAQAGVDRQYKGAPVTPANPEPLVAVKLTPVGRAQPFPVVDVTPDSVPRAGDRVVVRTENGQASGLATRIEMRQIGVRDEAKMIGGYGTCGRPLCCTTFLQTFEPVSIKMAKQQDLSLNPSKLSGLCGRLKCCLRYELPNAKGVVHGGCGDEGGCDNPTGCGSGGCGSGSCGSCKTHV